MISTLAGQGLPPSSILATERRAGITPEWRVSLARQLVDVVNLLWHRRASRIPEENLDAYLAMRWLRWEGGALVLTPLGQTVHDDQLKKVSA